MALTLEQVRIAAMELDPAQREVLAEELLLSITDNQREEVDAAWLAEAHKRDAAFMVGKTGAEPLDAVIDRFRARRPA